MTKNGPITETKTVLESGKCMGHFRTMENIFNSQSPVRNHPNPNRKQGQGNQCHTPGFIFEELTG